jgi:hypothetical protein
MESTRLLWWWRLWWWRLWWWRHEPKQKLKFVAVVFGAAPGSRGFDAGLVVHGGGGIVDEVQ